MHVILRGAFLIGLAGAVLAVDRSLLPAPPDRADAIASNEKTDPPTVKTAVPAPKRAAHGVGLAARTPWIGSRITGSPDPPLPFDVVPAFPRLKFDQPVDIAPAPGRKRLFVVEQAGKIYSFPDSADAATPDLAIDLAKEVVGVKQAYAIAFHPKFAQNRYCYVCCIRDADQPDGSRIVRFEVSKSDPPRIDPRSQKVVITWLSGGHNGCCLKFGPDGFLYISTGDGAGPNPPDPKRTGQDLSDLLSAILRIDVDHEEGGRNYRVPPDNPFIKQANARPEIWAYGLRNPWRMSFDRKTGDLWVGDVGWELWEMLIRVERGGNYGWSVMEGRQPTNPEWPRGPTPILPPTLDQPHSESSSITAGATYRGRRFSELVGAHVYGDYDTGRIWAARLDAAQRVSRTDLAETTLRIVGFTEDDAGELLLLHHVGGTIHRIARNPNKDRPAPFPRRLSETGLFASTADQSPAPGVIPYSINAAPWDDGAVSRRFVAVPGLERIKTSELGWQFPKDSVLVKTLALPDGTHRAPGRRVETQILHYAGNAWRAYSYRWNARQTDADLVGAGGADEAIEVADSAAPGGRRKQPWHFASRSECLRCHNPWSGTALAFQTPQLNRDHDYGGKTASQLDTLFHIGLCEPAIPEDKRTRMPNPRDASQDLSQRARAYLHANCAHCHRMHAGSAVLSKMQYDLPLDQTTMIGVRPTQGTFSILAAQVIAPADPCRSILLYRISKLGGGRMPHIGSQVVDPQGVALIEEWIDSLPAGKSDDPSGAAAAARRRQEERRVLDRLRDSAGEAGDVRARLVDELLSTTSGALMLLRAIDRQSIARELTAFIADRAAARDDISVRDLFERFLPEEKRIKRLGSAVRPDDILRLRGDASAGRRLFFETAGVQCKNCHRIHAVGRALGPDLDRIGQKYSPAQLLESILEPSKTIDPKYVNYLVESKDGRVQTGLLVRKDAKEIVLADPQGKTTVIASDNVERIAGQSTSFMPDLQLRDLTAQQVADLIAFLAALR